MDPSFTASDLHQPFGLPRGKLGAEYAPLSGLLLIALVHDCNRLNVALSFLVKVKYVFVVESLLAKLTKKFVLFDCFFTLVACCCSGCGLANNAADAALPAKETALLPFLLKHLIGLRRDGCKIDKRLCALQKILQIGSEVPHVHFVL